MRLPGRCAPPELVSGHSRDPDLHCSAAGGVAAPVETGIGNDTAAARYCAPASALRGVPSPLRRLVCSPFPWRVRPTSGRASRRLSTCQQRVLCRARPPGARRAAAVVLISCRSLWTTIGSGRSLAISAPTAARSRAARPTRGRSRQGPSGRLVGGYHQTPLVSPCCAQLHRRLQT